MKRKEVKRGYKGGTQRVATRQKGRKGGMIESKSGLPGAVPEIKSIYRSVHRELRMWHGAGGVWVPKCSP